MGATFADNTDTLTEGGKCELFGVFGFFIQFVLGVGCFSVLIIKRHFESPKRSIRIWLMDISKQGVSTLMIHFLNLFLAVTFSKNSEDDACVWYLDNVLMDTTLGVLYQWILIRCLEILARKLNIEALLSGCYYGKTVNEFSENTIDYSIWLSQMGIWCLITAISKFVNYIILNEFDKFFRDFGNYVLDRLQPYPKLELVFVMIIVPLLTSCMQYWVTDNFLKESDESRIERLSRGKELLEQCGPEYYDRSENKDRSFN